MKYKIKQDIQNWFNEGLQKDTFYCNGDIIYWNEWLNAWGKRNETYLYRMINNDFIEKNKELFEEIK